MKYTIPILLLSILPGFRQTVAQSFRFDQSIEVILQGEPLRLAWAGGMNTVQVSTIDLNGDEVQDLFIYDRSTAKISTFLSRNQQYIYAPDYESLFPPVMSWVLLRDYNCDGKKDLFTAQPGGVSLYRNITRSGPVQWLRVTDAIQTLGISGFTINLKIDVNDIPAIVDVDSDGDLDILHAVPFSAGNIEWNRNFAQERLGRCDTLILERVDLNWGAFRECGDCQTYLFDESDECPDDGGRIQHAGTSILLVDLDNDRDKDLLISESSCSNITRLINGGTPDVALFNAADANFPNAKPIELPVFPAAYYEDVDFDNQKDLIASPNTFENGSFISNFEQSVWYYKNTGTDALPRFSFQQEDFLQNEMIDLGESARPALADIDGDGDLDLWVGNAGTRQAGGLFYATLYYFENIGTVQSPVFELRDEDYLGLSDSLWLNIKPHFADFDQDGNIDLLLTQRNRNFNEAAIYCFLNTNTQNGISFSAQNIRRLNLSVGALDEIYLYDIDSDQAQDILIGRAAGNLEYWRNVSGNYQLITDTFLGIRSGITTRELSLDIMDTENDNSPDLITGDRSGSLKIYHNFTDSISFSLTPAENVIYNRLLESTVKFNFGQSVYPVHYMNHLLLGTGAGGLHYLQNNGLVNDLPENHIGSAQIKIYPNPATTNFSVYTGQKGEMRLYNILGEAVSEAILLPAGQRTRFDVSALCSGVYLLSIRLEHGEWREKVLVWK